MMGYAKRANTVILRYRLEFLDCPPPHCVELTAACCGAFLALWVFWTCVSIDLL